ncbi:MAG: YkgJ family cysteine cluster protein [Gammaproteobacteria bacterium]
MRDCNQCGKCCTNYGGQDLSASAQDLDQWRARRPDIAAYVLDDEIWFDPLTREPLTRCPWLQEARPGFFTCAIYADRPEDCRFYPVTVEQMVQDECEMLESHDVLRPRNAQRALDRIMVLSRPPRR